VKKIGRPSPGLMARLGVPVGRRVRKLRAVGGQTGRPPGRRATSSEGEWRDRLVWSLCSQSPHDEAVVARCAQWRSHQPPHWIQVKSREISQSMRAVKDSLAAPPRSLSDIAFVTRRRRCCQMHGRRHGKTGRTTTSGEWWFRCQRLRRKDQKPKK
jgi:hypothetical protein